MVMRSNQSSLDLRLNHRTGYCNTHNTSTDFGGPAMANKAKAVKKLPKTQSRLDGSARLKATAKAVGSKLEFETRALLGKG